MKIGSIYESEIIDFTHEGNGVAKVEGITIFIPNTLIGDKVEFEIVDIRKNFAIGKTINMLKASKDRIELEFDVKEPRGGIPLIEYSYPKQLEWKKNKVKTDLAKIAGLNDVDVNNTIGMENPYGYRNHVQIPVGEKNGNTVIGFYEANTNDIVDMESSLLQPHSGNRALKVIRSWVKEYNIKAYDKKTKKGILRHIGIRINMKDEVMVILVTGNQKIPNINELIYSLKELNVVSIYQNINTLNSSIIYGMEYKRLFGENRLMDYIGEYKFYVSPNSFFQVNRVQAEVLYNKVIEYLEPNERDIIYDLYCGIGSISLYIASKAKKVYGIEIVKEAIEDGRENARLNDIGNVEFLVGKAEEMFPKLFKKGIKGNKVVLDPPRKGCEKEVLEALVELNPEKIVYVSCNPSTMARDVKYLVDNGYNVDEVQPVDMFLYSAHIECVIGMQRKG